MRVHFLFLYAMIAVFHAMPAAALECANAGAVTTAPDDAGNVDATACGNSAVAGAAGSTALGHLANTAGAQSVALGFGASASTLGSIAVGRSAIASGEQSMALGWLASASGNLSTALGYRAVAIVPDTVIIGAIAGINEATNYANIGIGTPLPAQAVDVERSGAAARFQLTSFTDVGSEAPQYIQRRARGTRDAVAAVQNNDNLGLFSFRGHDGVAMGGSRATITAQAADNFTTLSTPTRLIFATTPVGSTTPQSVLTITPDGKLQVKGVNLNVPDFVFEDDYPLMPLNELKSFIDENGHLPGIAPAHEVREEGLDLAGSQMGLLQKVEELTLYTLQQQDQIQQQKERIAYLEAQQDRITQLEAQQERITHLETLLNQALAALD